MLFLRKNWKKILSLAAILIVGFLAYQHFFPSQKNNLETAKVHRGNLEEKLTLSGEISADEKATLQFQTGGQLAWVGVKVGDHVKKYQTLANLDQRQVQKTIQEDLNNYLSNRQDFDQNKDDTSDKAITDAIKRSNIKYQAALDNTVLALEIADLTRQFSNLWTPIEGIVTRIDTPYSGVNIVSPALAQFEVVNPKTVYFLAQADQTEVTMLAEGESGKLSLDAYPDESLDGTIKNISFTPTVGQTGTVYNLKFYFPNNNSTYQYKLGMTGDLSFVTSHKDNVLFVPNKFIKSDNGKKYVTVRNGSTDMKVSISTGLETESDTEIKSGLKEGQIIVVEK